VTEQQRYGAVTSPARARAAVTALFLLNGATFGSWVSRIPDVSAALALDEAELGLALFGVAAGAVAVMPFVAPAVRRLGSRRVTTAAALAFCASLPLLGLAGDLPALAGALVVFGATNGALDVSMNDNGGRMERLLERPIMGTLHAGFSGGAALGALVGGAVARAGVPASTHFAAVAVVLAAAAVSAGRSLADLPDPDQSRSPVRRRRGGIHLSGPLLTLLTIGLCAAFAEGAVSDWSALYLVNALGTSTAVGATGFVAFSTLMVIGRLTQDRLVHRFGDTTIRRVGASAAALGMSTALLTRDPHVAVAALGIVGAGLAASFPLAMSGASRLPGIAPANAVAAVSATAYTALLAGPPLVGLLADATSLRTALWTATACLTVIALLPKTTSADPHQTSTGRRTDRSTAAN
jgi:predicted MFS family arabinose efflux permease